MLSSDVGLTKEYLTATWFYLMTSQMPFGHSLPWKNSCAWSIRIRFLKTPLSVGILQLWFWSSVHFSQYLNYLFSNRLTLVPFWRFAATYQYNFSSSKPFISKKLKWLHLCQSTAILVIFGMIIYYFIFHFFGSLPWHHLHWAGASF